MLGINKSGDTTGFLCFGNGVNSQSRVNGCFRAIDFDYYSPRLPPKTHCDG